MGLPAPARAPRPPREAPAPTPAPAPPTAEKSFDVAAGKRRKVGGDEDEAPRTPGRFPGGVVFRVLFAGAIGFAFGWAVAWNGWFPGVFLASDIGLPIALMALLTGTRTVLQAIIPDDRLGKATGGIPRAAGWALGVHWSVSSITNVPQLAIGLGLGILLYQLYASRSRLAALGFPGFGPGLHPVVLVLGTYAAWLVLRSFIGAMSGFDIASGLAVLLVTYVVLANARRAARRLASWRPTAAQSPGAAALRAGERRVFVALLLGYLVFRFFISSQLPYGPIIEWFMVCIGVLFFAIIAADRIGTVPTSRTLPPPDRRTHVQRVVNLPDVRLADAEARLAVFLKTGRGTAWLHDHFARVMADSRLPDAEAKRLLGPLAGGDRANDLARWSPDQRGRLVADLVEAVRNARVRTGTLKAVPTVRAHNRAAAAPS